MLEYFEIIFLVLAGKFQIDLDYLDLEIIGYH